MIHQQIKELFFSSVEHIVSDISQYAAIPIPISREAKKSLPRNLFPFSFRNKSRIFNYTTNNFMTCA